MLRTAHKTVNAMAAVRDCGFELVDHRPYSPDLTPSDYFLFPPHKKTHLAVKQYRTGNNEVISAVEDFLEGQGEIFYTTGIQALQHRWKKCGDSRGDFCMLQNKNLVKFNLLHYSQPMNFSAHPHMVKSPDCIILTSQTSVLILSKMILFFYVRSYTLVLKVAKQRLVHLHVCVI